MRTGKLVVSDSQALLIMLDSLGSAWSAGMAFSFGATRDSSEKTLLLAQSAPVKSARAVCGQASFGLARTRSRHPGISARAALRASCSAVIATSGSSRARLRA